MNDDEKFFTQFKESPRPEFVAAVYKRINQPMNTQRKIVSLRQMALSFAVVCNLLLASLLAYPPTRAQAFNFLRKIGVFTITTEQPVEMLPTALPPGPAQESLSATSAAEASTVAGFHVLAPESLPDGYVAEGPLSILPNGNGKIVVSLFSNPEKGAFILINQYRYADGDAFEDNLSAQETVEDVQVRGNKGVWITGRMMSSPIDAAGPDQGSLHASSWLRWEESGIVYLVISDDLTLDAMLQLAQSLK